MRRKITNDIWEQVKTCLCIRHRFTRDRTQHGIPPGAILSRAQREGWTQQIQSAKALVKREDTTPAVAPFQAVAATLSELGETTRIAAARVHHRALTYTEILPAEELIQPSTSRAVKNHVQAAGLVHGWAEQAPQTQVQVNVLSFAAIRSVEESEAS